MLSLFAFGQTNLKIMSYNLLDFPIPLPNERLPFLTSILSEVQPDIFMVCELGSETAANSILNTALQTQDNRFARAVFVPNTSSSFQELQQLVFYNSHKLLLTAQSEIPTGVRDINHYTFKLKTENAATNPIYLEVFVAHLKSSQGASNEAARLGMVTDFIDVLKLIPTNHFVLIGGDFNLYKSTEEAYQKLLEATNNIVLVDPINRSGNWNNNALFADIHTQSTHTNTFYYNGTDAYGAGGGLNDRFDFILMSKNLQTSADLYYVANSYKAFGNNGNCYDKSINNTSCTGIFSQTTRNNLYNMSDHLPVVMELETPENTLAIGTQTLDESLTFNNGNLVYDWLELKTDPSLKGLSLSVYNQLGQTVYKHLISSTNLIKIDITPLKTGVYYIKIDKLYLSKLLKYRNCFRDNCN